MFGVVGFGICLKVWGLGFWDMALVFLDFAECLGFLDLG